MKKILIVAILLLSVAVSGWRANFQKTKKSAEQGSSVDQSILGSLYLLGEEVPQDYKQAFYWYKKSAEQGWFLAQFCLGAMYENGQGVLQNYKKAFYWYKKASRKNLKEAQYRLAYFYIEGDVVKQDREKAFSLNLKSAIQGYDKAQYAVGIMFENGIGTVKDFERAGHWYKKAADQGHKKAEKLLSELEKGDKLKTNKPSGAGSGFVISKKGHVATNYHVVDSCKKILIDGLEAVIIDSNKDDDIVILKVSNDYDIAASLSYKSAELGEDVLVFGYPLSYIFSNEYISLTKGSVSSLSGFKNNLSEFRFTASTQPGNSGGPIVGKDGKVVGLVSAVLGREAAEYYEFLPQNVNFGMKISLLLDMMRVNKVPISSSRVSENSVVKYYKEATKHIMCYE